MLGLGSAEFIPLLFPESGIPGWKIPVGLASSLCLKLFVFPVCASRDFLAWSPLVVDVMGGGVCSPGLSMDLSPWNCTPLEFHPSIAHLQVLPSGKRQIPQE